MKFFSKKQDDFFIIPDDEEYETEFEIKGENTKEPSHALTPEEVLSSKTVTEKRYDSTGALNSLKIRMSQAAVNDKRSLLEKCKPYIVDEKGNDTSVDTAPAYTLQSVDQILKDDSEKILDQLKQKYDISVDYLGKFVEEKTALASKKAEVKPEAKPAEKPQIEETEKEVFEERIEINTPVKNVHSSVPFVISDIDSTVTEIQKTDKDISSTSTITFTPVSAESSEKPKVTVNTATIPIDLTGEFENVNSSSKTEEDTRVTLQTNDFEDFKPENEFTNETQNKKFLREFSIKKRRSFLTCCATVFITALLFSMKLPLLSGFILGKTVVSMSACTALSFLTVLLNANMFLSVPKMFSKKAEPDVLASLAGVFVLLYAVIGIIKGEIVLDLLLCLSFTVALRSLSKFHKDSYMLSNFKQIVNSKEKNAVRMISDPAVTFAMAKDSIEGDTLICAPQKCFHIDDYIKYSTFGTFLNGKLPTVTVLSLIISLISGLTAFYYFDGIVTAMYTAAAIMLLCALPAVFFIDTLPLYGTAKKLNKSGCMIAGKHGAKTVENANALVLNSTDLFPIGTVTLHNMKVLSENSLDETILRAASLTETLNSPLAPIFKRIAGDSNITVFPDSDTVKYEDRMGISGWVDDKLLFIGNRTLMEAHGITVPSIEVDRKILHDGYFPVYVASGNKVCALLTVRYDVNPNVAKELRTLTKLGITVLVSNSDPNITKEMICDYLGLYDDSVMIMTTAGCHMYKSTVVKGASCSAPAKFRGGSLALAKIMNCANRIRKSNTLLSILYILFYVLGIIIFAYASFSGSDSIIDSGTLLLYTLISTAVTYILYLTQKP